MEHESKTSSRNGDASIELPPSHKKVLEKVRRMNAQEGFESLVASGIYTPQGQLTESYGGQRSHE